MTLCEAGVIVNLPHLDHGALVAGICIGHSRFTQWPAQRQPPLSQIMPS
jgi:hypothetical protein